MFGEKLKDLRKKMQLTQMQLADTLHVAYGTIAMWETNKRQPDFEMVAKIANYFNVSIDYLLGNNQSFEVKNIETVNIDSKYVKIPVYGTIPAGIPIEMIEDSFIEDFEYIPTEWLHGNQKYFCLKVKGESMMPKFEDGDVLVLKQQEDCQSGDFCAVSINHTECTFKKVIKKESGITLQPLNPIFEPIYFSNRDIVELPIVILGVVKEIRRSI